MLRKFIIPIVSISLLLLGSSLACAVDAVRIPSGDLKISNGDIRLPTTGSGIVLSDSSVMRKLSDAGGITKASRGKKVILGLRVHKAS